MSDVLFVSTRGKVQIKDDGSHYSFYVANRIIWVDRDERILNALVQLISNYSVERSGSTLKIKDKNGKYVTTFLQWIYCKYHNKQLREIKNGKIKTVDSNEYNYMKNNLIYTRDSVSNNNIRLIKRHGDYILIYLKGSGAVAITDYNEELYSLLCDNRLRWFMRNGYIVFDYWYYCDHKSLSLVGLHTLVYCFHHYGARKNSILSSIRKMQRDFEREGLQLDHLDSDSLNDCACNLSPMTKQQNGKKRHSTRKIVAPYFFITAYDNGVYKVYCGAEKENAVNGKYYFCKDVDTFIAFIYCFYESNSFFGKTPKEVYRDNSDGKCLSQYFISANSRYDDAVNETYSIKDFQRELAKIPKEKCTVWTIGNEI